VSANETLDLDAIEARAKAATPGPWFRVDPPWGDSNWVNAQFEDPHGGLFIADCEAQENDGESEGNAPADAEFIAHARTDVPALFAAVRERDAEIARLRDALGDAVGTVAGGQLCSIGAIGNTRVAQVDVARLDRWREALRQTGTEPPQPAEGA